MSEHQRAIIERFKRASTEYDLASKAIEDHFLPLMRAAIERGDIEAARIIQKEMPADSVPAVFGLDMISQARLKIDHRTNSDCLSYGTNIHNVCIGCGRKTAETRP